MNFFRRFYGFIFSIDSFLEKFYSRLIFFVLFFSRIEVFFVDIGVGGYSGNLGLLKNGKFIIFLVDYLLDNRKRLEVSYIYRFEMYG